MKIAVIADDLTGANATGVRLTKQGFQATTMVYYDRAIPSSLVDAVCVDTDSRYADRQVAQERVEKALEHFQNWEADVFCKRIDSTVRGNIGIEIDTILNALGEKSVAVVVASFPESGRITSGGYLLVNGVPVQQTDVAKDPVAPLTESFIPSIVRKQSEFPVSHIGLEDVLSGKNRLLEKMQAHIADGSRIIVLDAVTNEEIEDIAQAMLLLEDVTCIPADPGPLTAAYARAYIKRHSRENKVIMTVGSVTSNTKIQMKYLLDKTKAKPIYVDANHFVRDSIAWEKEISRVVEAALAEMDKKEIVIVTTILPGVEQLDLQKIAAEQKVHKDYLAKRIADGLAKITRRIHEESEHTINGIFSCGGDITASLCSVSSATGIKLKDEVRPLIAYGQFIDGHLDGMPIITKGGMAGDKKAMYKSFQHLLMQGSKAITQK